MNRLFYNSGFVASMVTGTTVTATLLVTQSSVTAKTATEIAAIARETTVKIDNTLGVPGGSGVIIAKQDNIYTVLTANHVVANPNVGYIVKTGTEQHSVGSVKSLKQQTGLDLAVVTFKSPQAYSVATLGDSKYASAGANVYVSGFPLSVDLNANREHEFTTGMITSIREGATEGYAMRYQALTRRGMSGGPVFDTSGNLIGVHGQGDVIGSVRNESSSIPEPLKTGFNAAIPIENFRNSLEIAGLSDDDLIVKGGKPDEPEAEVDVEATKKYVEGIELLQSGDTYRANDYLIEAAQENPNNALAVYYQGLIDYTQRDLDSAIANYDQAIAVNPNFSLAYFSRGLANYRLGNRQQALEDYNHALRINPIDPWSYVNRGLVREDLDDIAGALSDYNRAIKIDPDYGKSYHNRGAIRYYQRNFEGAVADFQKASELFFQQGDDTSYNVAMDSLNKAQKALRNAQVDRQIPSSQFRFPKLQPNQPIIEPSSNSQPVSPDTSAENSLRDL
ncbi:serine protease [Pleurocapsales cyanobacterium LEGE 10410]|nr:serine protease [Pleurocapsales cyanobacterium LEGE 10410]